MTPAQAKARLLAWGEETDARGGVAGGGTAQLVAGVITGAWTAWAERGRGSAGRGWAPVLAELTRAAGWLVPLVLGLCGSRASERGEGGAPGKADGAAAGRTGE
jgi:hypothetical protein